MALRFYAPVWAQPREMVDLARLAVPVALSRLSLPVMTVTDAVVLGNMAQFEVSFITLSWLVLSVAIAVGLGVLQGVQVFTAELNGNGQYEDTGRVFRRGLLVGAILSAVFTAIMILVAEPVFAASGLEPHVVEKTTAASHILAYGLVGHMACFVGTFYLEALRKPKIVTVLMYAGAVINLIFNMAFVAGWWGFPEMGAEGVAWASTGSRAVVGVALLVVVWMMTPGFKSSKPAPPNEFVRQHTVGLGGAVANVAEFLGFNLTFLMAAQYSLFAGTVYSLGVQPLFVSFNLFVGVATATSVRVAEAYGRKDFDGVRNAARLGVSTSIAVGVLVFVVMGLLSGLLADGMTADNGEEVAKTVTALTAVVFMAAIVSGFDGLQVVSSTALRAQEIVWSPAALHITSYFVVMLPAVYWLTLVQGRGALGAMEGVLIGSVVAAVGQTILLEIKTARRKVLHAA